MLLKIPNRGQWLVDSFEEASSVYGRERLLSGLGASKFREGKVFDWRGKVIARVSYNGRVWAPEKWEPGQEPIFDNRKSN